MAGLLRQLHHFSIGLGTHVAHKGDALLQVHLQRQQAAMAYMTPQHRSMHTFQPPAHIHGDDDMCKVDDISAGTYPEAASSRGVH